MTTPPPSPPTEQAEQTPDEASPHWARRAMRVFAWGTAGLAVLLVSLVSVALCSDAVAAYAVKKGLAAYTDGVPGAISVGEVRGDLWSGLVLEDLTFDDAQGQSLARVGSAQFGVALRPLLVGRVHAKGLRLDEVDVHLPKQGAAGFADLSSPSPNEAVSPSVPGPDLPIDIDIALQLGRVTLHASADAPEQGAVFVLESASLAAAASGRTASAQLELAAKLPGQSLDLQRVVLRAAWDETRLSLQEFSVRSNWGDFDIEPSEVEFRPEPATSMQLRAGTLPGLHIVARQASVQERAGLNVTGPVELSGHASTSAFGAQGELSLRAPGVLGLDLAAEGSWAAGGQLGLSAELELDPAILATGSPVHVHTQLHVARPHGETVALRARIACDDCTPDEGSTTLDATLHYNPTTRQGGGQARLILAGALLQIDADLQADGHLVAELDGELSSLQRIETLAARFVEVPTLRGHGRAHLTCKGELEAELSELKWLECDTQVRLDQGVPIEFVALEAHATLRDSISVEVSKLLARADGHELELLTPTARFGYDAGAITFEGLDIALRASERVGKRLGKARAQARLSASGQWSLDDSTGSRVEADITAFDLALLNRFSRGLGAGGKLDAHVVAQGPAASPTVTVAVQARGLRYQGRSVGRLRAQADASDGRTQLSAKLSGALTQDLQVRVDLPLAIALDGEAPSLRAHDRASASLQVGDLDLAVLGDLLKLKPSLKGAVDAKLALRGSLAAPTLTYEVALTDGTLDGQVLGKAQVKGSFERGRVSAALDWTHRAWQRFHLSASTGVHMDLAQGRVALRPQAQDGFELELKGLSLKRLREQLPKSLGALPTLDGSVDLAVLATKIWTAPSARVDIAGHALKVAGANLGRVQVNAEFEQEQLSVLATLHEARLGDAAVKASIPLRLDLLRGKAQWLSAEVHDLDIAIAGTQLAALDALAARDLFLSGVAEVTLGVHGPLHAANIEFAASVDQLSYAGRRVGEVDVTGGYGDASSQPESENASGARAGRAAPLAHVDLRVVHDAQRRVNAMATIPLRLNLLDQSLEWLRDRPHEVRVSAPHIDQVLLAPFLETPEGTTFDIGGRFKLAGTVDTFTAQLAAEGEGTRDGKRIPLALTADLGPKLQSLALLVGDTSHPWISTHAELRAPIVRLVDQSLDPSSQSTDAQWPDIPVLASVEARDFELAELQALLPPALQGVEGTLNVLAAVDGSLRQPSLSGSLGLKGGRLTVVPLRQRFWGVDVNIDLDRDRIELRQLVAQSGQGTLFGSGEARLADATHLALDIDLEARELPIRRPGMPRMKLSAKVASHATLGAEGGEFDIKIARSELQIQKGNASAPKAIEELDGVHFIELVAGQPAWSRAGIPGDDEKINEAKRPSQPSRLSVSFLEPLRVVGPGIDMSWDGAVAARENGQEVLATGALTCTKGRFDLLGNDFTITDASVRLPEAGGLMPYIDLQATTAIEDVEITATLRGPVSRPSLTLTSQPAFSESDIFTMLVTGSSDVSAADPAKVRARAASMLAALSNPALQAQVNETLHVDKVGLTFGDTTDQPILSVGKQISKRLYVETQHTFNAPSTKNGSQLSLRYRFAPRWSLETFLGDAAVGGADIFWGLAFDGQLSQALKQNRAQRRDK